jgi:hypothetical protein
MTDIAAILQEPPIAGSELDTMLGSLERQRRTFAWKCTGLSHQQLGAVLAPSAITIGGLIKHVALVEATYFSWRLPGADIGEPWNGIDWDADPDWEWRTAAEDSPQELMELWRREVRRARASVARVIENGGLDTLANWTSPEGDTPSLRRIIIDMIEEYARHIGHADLIRESIDGQVGEDPPPTFSESPSDTDRGGANG